MSPRGILRNKPTEAEVQQLTDHLDRQEVINNTRLNAQLSSSHATEGDLIRAQLAESKAGEAGEENTDHLKWDELNLYKTEQEKSATMKIDEPKTPYEGGFNPEGEYYRDDDEDIPNFELGEGEFDKDDSNKIASLNGSEITRNEGDEEFEDDDEEEAIQETAEERHKRFEEMRKAHYHLKGNALHHKIEDLADDVENDQE